MSTWAWIGTNKHVWAPPLLLLGIMLNGLFIGKRWPSTSQWMHLFACVCSLSGAAHVWLDAAGKQEDPSSWGQIIGALAIVIITIESAWKVLRDLTARQPTPPPPPP